MFSLPLAPLLATAQVKSGETQEEEANSGEVGNTECKAGFRGVLGASGVTDFWNLRLTRDTLRDQATADHWRYRSSPQVTGLLNETAIQKWREVLYWKQKYKPL